MTVRTKFVILSSYTVEDKDEPVLNDRAEAIAKAEKDSADEGRTYYVAEVIAGFKPAPVAIVPIGI